MSTILGWVEAAKLWVRVLEQPGEARRCVAEAEKLPAGNNSRDYTSLAEGLVLIDQTDLAVEYLEKAESLVAELSEWSTIASAWIGLECYDRAERAIGEGSSSKLSDDEPVVYRDSKGRYVRGESRR